MQLREESGWRSRFIPHFVQNSHLYGGWRTGVFVGLVCTIVVFLLNLVVLIVSWLHFPVANGLALVFQGDCAQTRQISLWTHLVINILSTLLLGASNNGSQCLTSPIRSEVEKSHATDQWLDIGIPSFRNLFVIDTRRKILWSCLMASSLPLHLL